LEKCVIHLQIYNKPVIDKKENIISGSYKIYTMKSVRFLLVILFSFGCYTANSQGSFSYKITGEIKGLKNDTLYLSVMSGEAKISETIRIAGHNDKLDFEGVSNQPYVVWAQTSLNRGTNGNFTFFIEKGKIHIDGTREDLTLTKVTGTLGNNDYTYIQSRKNGYYSRMTPMQARLRETGDTSSIAYKEARAQLAILQDSLFMFYNDYVSTHPNSLAAGMVLVLIADKIPVTKLEEHYNNLNENVKQVSILSKMASKIESKKKSVIGSMATDFIVNDINGKPVQLTSYRGNYVLLDFWASWCIPCRQENPYLKAAYEKFKNQNFVVIGVSLDEDDNKWKQAIEKDQLPWVHISDLQKPNKIAVLYGVQPIPDNYLIDPAGKIIERGIRGENLEKTLTQIIK